jgi:hypothetical protein
MNLFVGVMMAMLVAQTAPVWSVTFDPATAGASGVHWTVTLAAPYCGGYKVGDGVHIAPEAPLALPTSVPAEDVAFAGTLAEVSVDEAGALVVNQSPRVARSQICMDGDRPLTVELLPGLGLTNPDAGTYVVDVWTGASPTPVQLPVEIAAADD